MSKPFRLPVRSEGPSFKASNTHLYLPDLRLSSCVRAYALRKTSGLNLSPQERLNHYAATPLCTLIWTFEGMGERVSRGDEVLNQIIAPRILISGPQTLASVSRNLGDVHGMMMFLMPDALYALTGIGIESLVDQSMPLGQVLDASWVAMAEAVLATEDDAEKIRLIESFLLPRWEACRTHRTDKAPRYQEWMTGLATRVALSAPGTSVRQLERRIKRWSGLSLQRLRGLARAEASFFEARKAQEREMLVWAEVAFNMGFSDQAHMCREVRRMTGFSPEEFREALRTEESFWLYRLWM